MLQFPSGYGGTKAKMYVLPQDALDPRVILLHRKQFGDFGKLYFGEPMIFLQGMIVDLWKCHRRVCAYLQRFEHD